MKHLKELLSESADIKSFNNKKIIKKVVDIFSKDLRGKDILDDEEKINVILDGIDEDSTFAEIILKGKFPAATTDDRYGFTNRYDFENTEIIFSAVKNEYMSGTEFTIKFYNKIYSQYMSNRRTKSSECQNRCKIEAIAKYYGGFAYI